MSTAASLSLSAPPSTLKWKRVRCCEERVISSNRLAPCVGPRSLADFQSASLVSRSSPRLSRDSIDEFGFHDPSLLENRGFPVSVDSFRRKIGKNTKLSLRGSSTLLHSPFSSSSFLPSFLPERTTRRETTPQSRHHERRTDRIVTLTVAAREETKRWENAVSTRRVAADISACRPNVSAISRARE